VRRPAVSDRDHALRLVEKLSAHELIDELSERLEPDLAGAAG
jgi:hypothetical protein